MAWRFRRSAKLGPFRLNFSKSGIGISAGVKGFRVGRAADGRSYTSASIPGTGLYNRQYSGKSSGVRTSKPSIARKRSTSSTNVQTASIAVGAIIAFVGFIIVFSALTQGIVVMAVGGIIIAAALAARRPRFERALKEAQSDLEQGKHQEARHRLLPFVKHFPDNLSMLATLGMAYAGTGQHDLSEDSFRKLHERSNSSISAQLYSDRLRQNRKPRDAIAVLQKITPEEEHAATHYTMLGNCFLDLGDTQAAIDAFKSGPLLKRKLDDNLLALHLALGGAYEKLGDRKSALKEYQKVRVADIQFEDVEERIKRLGGGQADRRENDEDRSAGGQGAEG